MPDNYWFVASTKTRNVLRISSSPGDAREWAIWLNDRILADKYGSPDEAADSASRKDFAITFWVPSDLRQWRTTDPNNPLFTGQPQIPTPPERPESECKNRPWKKDSGSGRFNVH